MPLVSLLATVFLRTRKITSISRSLKESLVLNLNCYKSVSYKIQIKSNDTTLAIFELSVAT